MGTPHLDGIIHGRILRRVNQAEAAAELSALKAENALLAKKAALADEVAQHALEVIASFDAGFEPRPAWNAKDYMARHKEIR